MSVSRITIPIVTVTLASLSQTIRAENSTTKEAVSDDLLLSPGGAGTEVSAWALSRLCNLKLNNGQIMEIVQTEWPTDRIVIMVST